MKRALIVLALAFPASAEAAQPPKVLQRFDGTLSAPASGAPRAVALRYVRANLDDLGLDRDDLDTLQAPTTQTAGAITTVRWRQAVDGIPAADSELRVNLASDGRVLSVLGEPAHDLRANTTAAITAGEAVRAVQDATSSYRPLPRDRGPSGPTQATTYADDTTAELALDDRRLVWRVTYRADAGAVYDAFVDARSGLVRRKVNLVKNDTPATVWENYPGAPQGGTASLRNLETSGWLAPGAAVLSGPNAHAYSDVDDDDVADLSEEVTGPFAIAVNTAFAPAGGGCLVAKPCTWNHDSANSWTTNRRQSVVQAFYFANRFHDHLATAPIGFGPASGSFDEGVDPVQVQTHDSAGRTQPDFNNASMYTPPDGRSPEHGAVALPPTGLSHDQRRRRRLDRLPRVHARALEPARHRRGRPRCAELAAGGRAGRGLERLVREGLHRRPVPDAGYGRARSDRHGQLHRQRRAHDPQRRRSTARSARRRRPARRPGPPARAASPTATSAGSRVSRRSTPTARSGPQTLWDLRGVVGVAAARRLITDGMRLSPPEPSFLDMRNAILLADQAAGAAHRDQIWAVFAGRGMGYFATAEPLQDFSTPPAPGVPRGAITGVIADAATGRPIAGATAAIGGLADGPDRLAGTSGADGSYTVGGVPSRTYPSVVVSAPGYDRAIREVTVPTGSAVRVDVALHRNWASLSGGARTLPGPGSDEYADQGCGPDAAVDQLQTTAWSTRATAGGKSMVVTLPQTVDVTEFALDPSEGCGDDADSATRDYRIETSASGPDGPWAVAAAGAFDPLQRHTLTAVPATVAGVQAVRLTLLSNQLGGGFLDFSELVVHGSATAAPLAATPTPTPTPGGAGASPAPALRAPSFTLPASGKRTVRFKVRCFAACRVTAKLTVDRPTARKLGLGRKLTAASLTRSAKAGTTTLTLKLSSKAAKALKQRKVRTFRARLKVTAAYPGVKPVSRSRQLTVKR